MVEIGEKAFYDLVKYMKINFGINLEHKKNLIEVRLGNCLHDMGYDTFDDYMQCLIADHSGTELSNLVNKLTTNHTFFMREESHFNFLRNIVLPQITNGAKEKDIRIWSAGCSSGEEPYTVAMLLDDYFGFEKPLWDTRVLATDISGKVLDLAKKGVYSYESAEMLPDTWKKRYCKMIEDGKFEISPKIKNDVIFRSFNLMQEIFPFKKKFHVIFCRNVMIYFDNETKKELVHKLYEHTEDGGYLFIGHSESIGRENTRYNYIKPAVYRKL